MWMKTICRSCVLSVKVLIYQMRSSNVTHLWNCFGKRISPVHTSCECKANVDVTNSQRITRSSCPLHLRMSLLKEGRDVPFTSNSLRICIRRKYEPGFIYNSMYTKGHTLTMIICCHAKILKFINYVQHISFYFQLIIITNLYNLLFNLFYIIALVSHIFTITKQTFLKQ